MIRACCDRNNISNLVDEHEFQVPECLRRSQLESASSASASVSQTRVNTISTGSLPSCNDNYKAQKFGCYMSSQVVQDSGAGNNSRMKYEPHQEFRSNIRRQDVSLPNIPLGENTYFQSSCGLWNEQIPMTLLDRVREQF